MASSINKESWFDRQVGIAPPADSEMAATTDRRQAPPDDCIMATTTVPFCPELSVNDI
jgi:hypothetical protein